MQRKGFDESSKSKLPRRTFLIVSATAIIVLALLAGVKPALAAPTITANPNPVLIAQGKNEGTTTLNWDAGIDRSDSRVWLQVDGGREELFAASAKGTSEIKVVIDKTYTFRLYSGDGAQVLASIVVKGKRASPSLPKIPGSESSANPAYIYGVLPDGTLRWFRHDGRGRGTADWQGPRDMTSGMNSLKQAFAAGRFLFYTVSADGILKRFYHSSTDQALDLPTIGTEVPREVGNGWQNFKQVFSAGEDTVYAVAQDGTLKWYRLDSPITEQSPTSKEKTIKTGSPLADELARQKGGMVKAMLYLDSNGKIVRCFNSFLMGTAANTLPCGFTARKGSDLKADRLIVINFGFKVDDRFILTTPVIGNRFQAESTQPTTAPIYFHPAAEDTVVVTTSRGDQAFMIFVF